MKKALAIVMALALMLTCIVFVSADVDVTATVATIDGPFSAGDEIAIPVTITEWSNAYAAVSVGLPEYDENLLTFDGFEGSSTSFNGALASSGPNCFALIASPGDDNGADKLLGGEVCVMYFIAAADIEVPTTVSVEVDARGFSQGAEDQWLASQPLLVETVNGGINVAEDEHTCTPSGDIQYDETYHWYNCETVGCGNQLEKAPHEGGTATCSAKAECSVCGAVYGNLNSSNHAGGTEIRNASSSYTGDTYCLGCGTMTQKGSVVGDEVPAEVTATVATLDGPFAAGDEIAIPVTITEWANAYATIAVSLPEYDESLMTFDGYEGSSTSFSGALASSGDNGFALVASPGSSREANKLKGGEVCIMYFIAKTDINASTTVSVKVDAEGYTLGAEDSWRENRVLTVKTVDGGIYVDGGDDGCTHTGGEATCSAKAVCDICGEEYGEFDADNHAGETEVRGASNNNCGTAGYTGDTYCLDCDQIIDQGDVLPATGNHTGGEATCNAKAECSVCGTKYGETNKNNHTGGTEIRNESEDYTGDTYCLGCGEMIAEGRPILPNTGSAIVSSADAKLGDTVTVTVSLNGTNALACYGATLVFDETELELVDMNAGDFCYMVNVEEKLAFGYNETDITSGTLFTADFKVLKANGDFVVNVVFDADATANSYNIPVTMTVTPGVISVECEHEGGEATCSAKAVCDICGEEYGEIDADNHVGETEIRDANDQYTGDTYCLDCGEMIEEGTVIKLYGDADGSKSVTVSDAMIVAQYSARMGVTIDLTVSDVDGDGKVTISDAMIIAQYSAKLINKFPVEDKK